MAWPVIAAACAICTARVFAPVVVAAQYAVEVPRDPATVGYLNLHKRHPDGFEGPGGVRSSVLRTPRTRTADQIRTFLESVAQLTDRVRDRVAEAEPARRRMHHPQAAVLARADAIRAGAAETRAAADRRIELARATSAYRDATRAFSGVLGHEAPNRARSMRAGDPRFARAWIERTMDANTADSDRACIHRSLDPCAARRSPARSVCAGRPCDPAGSVPQSPRRGLRWLGRLTQLLAPSAQLSYLHRWWSRRRALNAPERFRCSGTRSSQPTERPE